MIDKFYVPDDFTIDWSVICDMDIATQAIWLFLYSQKGKTTSIDAMQMIFRLDTETIERAVLTVFAIKGGLQWTDF